jgi:hypothetical protein
MRINPNEVQWDEAPKQPKTVKINPNEVQWDNAPKQSVTAPTQQVSEVPTGRKFSPFDILSAPFEMGMKAGAAPANEQIALVRPTVEALGSVAGGTIGAPMGPAGVMGGAGLGYGIAKGGLDIAEQALGYRKAPSSAAEALGSATKDVIIGASLEGLGRGVVSPVASVIGKYVDKVRNVKLDTYINALEGKGNDILNALVGKRAAVPGAVPGAAEVAAPAGSVKFSMLGAKSEKVPSLSSQFAEQQAQTTTAQTQQQARAQTKFDNAAAKVQQKMDSALNPLRPEDAGEALAAGAEAKRQAMKTNVIAPAYENAFKAAGGTKIDMSDVVSKAEEILGRKLSQFDPSTAPQTVSKLRSLQAKSEPPTPIGKGKISGRIQQAPAEPLPPEVTLRDLDDIRKAINSDIQSARTSNDPNIATRLRNLSQIHSTIDDAVNQSGLSPEAKTLYKKALDTYRQEYVPRFRTGVNEQIFRTTALNEPKIKPEDVITKYFQPRGVSEAKNFVTLFGDDPKAMQTARAGIEDLYLREVKVPTPEAHAAFLKKYADPIKVLDDAGMNVLSRINVVGTNAARLKTIDDMAKAANIKLSAPLPPGATADAVNKRISELTKGLTPQQLSNVNAVRQDLIRRGEYERLVKAGTEAGVDIKEIGTRTGESIGMPLPALLNRGITIFNAVYKRLITHLDDKLAMEIAREMTDPALAAESVKKAISLTEKRAVEKLAEKTMLPERAVTQGLGQEMVRRATPTPRNNLAPQQENQNALAR